METTPATGTQPTFHGGMNIALKLPRAQFDQTVAFYRDVLGLHVTDKTGEPGVVAAVPRCFAVQFGPVTLWLDLVDNYARSDVWLELITDDVPGAVTHLAGHGIGTRDELEPFPDGLPAHWISNPAGVVHLVRTTEAVAEMPERQMAHPS